MRNGAFLAPGHGPSKARCRLLQDLPDFMPIEPYRLTDLSEQPPGLRRAIHGYSTAGTWRRLAWRVAEVGFEVARSLPRDAWRGWRPGPPPLLRLEPGEDARPGARSVALYVHYAASGRVSEMVLRQVAALAAEGFAVVFVTMAAAVPEADWQAVRARAALVAQRRNFGLDFGAWRDLAPEAARRWPAAEEVLLANDSVLGPIRPLGPVLAAMRAGGAGVFGMTESIQGGPHLQSYFLLSRGEAAVADLQHFLGMMRISHSKWLVVQRGELRFARWMRGRGHRVAALFGYRRLVGAVLADPAERALLAASHPLLRGLEAMAPEERAALLAEQPLNPTHHLWAALIRCLGYPFLKTELIRRNPGRLPGVADWAALVPAEAPCPPDVIRAQLAALATQP
ncbi:Rhamnan synthesis protein F [Belnapia rosea]|uniref:Rhamnan synthesis protein F n=2 Tax=Belnapia rosea TaxID=938405 RepID=A0A1G6WCB7_9PROT|nr:Rhamnan synthesis protein F [Belnapia rosea]